MMQRFLIGLFAGALATAAVIAIAQGGFHRAPTAPRQQVAADGSPTRGMKVFAESGCAVCHRIGDVGGTDAPKLDAPRMRGMRAMDMAASMWNHAPSMAPMMQEEIGGFVNLDGRQLSDLIAFLHDSDSQRTMTPGMIPKRFSNLDEVDGDHMKNMSDTMDSD